MDDEQSYVQQQQQILHLRALQGSLLFHSVPPTSSERANN